MAPTGDRSLSGYWRVDASDVRMREMASILGGAANMASLLGTGSGVQWVGEHISVKSGDLDGIHAGMLERIDPPFPGTEVDRVFGRFFSEMGRKRWSAPVEDIPGWSGMGRSDRGDLRRVFAVLEDTYSYRRYQESFPVLGEYLKAFKPKCPAGPDALPLAAREDRFSRDFIINTWEMISLLDSGIPDWFPEKLEGAMLYFLSIKAACENEPNSHKRLFLAEEATRWVQQYPKTTAEPIEWYLDNILETLDSLPSESLTRRSGGGESGQIGDLTGDMSQTGRGPFDYRSEGDYELVDETGQADITRMLNRIGVSGALTRIKDADFDHGLYMDVRRQVESEISQIRQVFAKLTFLETRWRHGRKAGRVDGRRLTRAAAGKDNVFKVRDKRDKSSLGIVLAIDVSASMNPYLDVVQKTACIFSEALRALQEKLWFEVITYTGQELYAGSDVQLSRLASTDMPLSLKNIWIGGGTPTAEALGASFLLLKERGLDRKLIIHFTDGHSRQEEKIKQILDRCSRSDTDVITISLNTPQEELYGTGRAEVIQEVSQLPETVTTMLKRVFRR